MNTVILTGRLTRDPADVTKLPNSDVSKTTFNIAVDRPKRKGKEAEADFIRITVFGAQADNCGRYLSKGRQVAVLGRIQTGSYKNKDGVTVYTTDVIADRVEFMGSGGSHESVSEPVSKEVEEAAPLDDNFQVAEDDIPF